MRFLRPAKYLCAACARADRHHRPAARDRVRVARDDGNAAGAREQDAVPHHREEVVRLQQGQVLLQHVPREDLQQRVLRVQDGLLGHPAGHRRFEQRQRTGADQHDKRGDLQEQHESGERVRLHGAVRAE